MIILWLAVGAWGFVDPRPPYQVMRLSYCSDPEQLEHYVAYGADQAALERVNRETSLFEHCRTDVAAVGFPWPEDLATYERPHRAYGLRQILLYGREVDGTMQMFKYPVIRFVIVELKQTT